LALTAFFAFIGFLLAFATFFFTKKMHPPLNDADYS